jgi:archaellum component FlaC
MGAQLVINKLQELDKVQDQVARGIITVREALSQRIRILTDVQALVREMLVYDLGE